MERQRIPREGKTHSDVDLTKPVKAKEIMSEDRAQKGDTCFSYLWDMDTTECATCADNEMCGILYHKRQKKLVKELEKEMPPMLDTSDFEGINKDDLIMWLRLKPRRTGELVEKVSTLVKCDDVDTLRYWTTSFIKENPRLSVKNAIVIVND